ncbi:MAG: hypothetical protein LBR59_02595 [Endomicrobium sp.]|jgi:TrmH family RNA methyltransferase|nr:hypothetical protein [Endomicrobium sp.]
MLIKRFQNQIFKNFLKLRDKKFRRKNNVFLVEGKKQIFEISKDWNIRQIIVSQKYEAINTFEKPIILSEQLFQNYHLQNRLKE